MKFDFNLATFVVGILSLSGVVLNIVFTTINNRKKRYTDLITQRRLHTFQLIIDCSSRCVREIYGLATDKRDSSILLQNFVENKAQIFYNTNYKASAEKELRDALDALERLFVCYVENEEKLTKNQKAKIFEVMKAGADYYQVISAVYCKCEWVRIKETALSVKDTMDTQKAYFDRVAEIEKDLEKNKNILFENTFEKIVKKSKD